MLIKHADVSVKARYPWPTFGFRGLMRRVWTVLLPIGLAGVPAAVAAGNALGAPLALYDTARDSTALAPLAPSCGSFAVACSAAQAAAKTALPFDYGVSVSGVVGGSRNGTFGGESVSGWVKAKDIPVTLYFDLERFQPIGRR